MWLESEEGRGSVLGQIPYPNSAGGCVSMTSTANALCCAVALCFYGHSYTPMFYLHVITTLLNISQPTDLLTDKILGKYFT